MKYENEEDIAAFVARFEAGAVTRDEWRHHEHLTVALYYVAKFGRDGALERMRSGIHGLLRAFGIDPSAADTPYHETLTVFWVDAVADFLAPRADRPLCATDAELAAVCDKDFPLRFYSRETLFGERAKREFVAPDLASK